MNLAPPSKHTGDCSTQVEQETYPWDSISPEGWGSHRQRATRGGAEPEAQQCSGPDPVEKNALNSATSSSSMLSTRQMVPAGTSPCTNDPQKRDR